MARPKKEPEDIQKNRVALYFDDEVYGIIKKISEQRGKPLTQLLTYCVYNTMLDDFAGEIPRSTRRKMDRYIDKQLSFYQSE